MSNSQRKKILQTLLEYDDRFAGKENKLEKCTVVQHTIETGDVKPIRQAPNARVWKERVKVKDQYKEMEEAGVIEPTNSPWRVGVLLVQKKDGKRRFCVYYRRQHLVAISDVYPLPRIE